MSLFRTQFRPLHWVDWVVYDRVEDIVCGACPFRQRRKSGFVCRKEENVRDCNEPHAVRVLTKLAAIDEELIKLLGERR